MLVMDITIGFMVTDEYGVSARVKLNQEVVYFFYDKAISKWYFIGSPDGDIRNTFRADADSVQKSLAELSGEWEKKAGQLSKDELYDLLMTALVNGLILTMLESLNKDADHRDKNSVALVMNEVLKTSHDKIIQYAVSQGKPTPFQILDYLEITDFKRTEANSK